MLDAPTDAFPKLHALETAAQAKTRLSVGVAYPCSKDAIAAAMRARANGHIEPILVGPPQKIREFADAIECDLGDVEIVETADDPIAAARSAVALASAGKVKALMKGSLHTDELLGAVVARDANLRTGRRISHVFWIDSPAYKKPLMITDAVINITPGLTDKIDILKNALDLAHRLGMARPKVAILSAMETVNPAVATTIDAAALCQMARRGQITGADIDGPLALDNAISAAAAETKGISSAVAGDPDILLVPGLEAGNILYKSLIYLGGAECAGLVVGAAVPIILTSRAESQRSRIASCALAQLAVG